MTDALRYLADLTRPIRQRLGLTRQSVSDESPAGGRVGWNTVKLWVCDVTRPLRRQLGLVRKGEAALVLGADGDSPLGLDHRVFVRHLSGEDRLRAWQTFSHEFWERGGPTPSAEHLRFLFRRGFFPDRWWNYAMKKNGPDAYLSDIQGALLYRLNGIYAPVLDNRLLLRRAMDEYCQVPAAWYLLEQDGKGLELSPAWSRLTSGTGAPEVLVLVQPMDAASQGRSAVFRVKDGEFEGGGKKGGMRQLLTLVRTWALSAGSSYLFSELVEQGEFAKALFPHAANHLHVVMLRNPDTWEPQIAAAVLRIGTRRSAPMDDFEQGGISAWVDTLSGTISRCLQLQGSAAPRELSNHPDSGTPLVGQMIPEWPQAMETLMTLFEQSSYLRACSFDFVLTDSGLALTDASPMPDLGALQAHEPLGEKFRHFIL